MIRETFAVGPLGCNCSIVADEQTKLALVIDPGGEFESIRSRLEEQGLTVTGIVHTHTHIDHVGATAPLQRHTGAEAHIHEADRFLYRMLPVQAALIGVPLVESCDVVGTLKDDVAFPLGSFEVGVVHTPGHTPGSVCFKVEASGESLLFSGDTLFQRSIGRTDLWGGDAAQLMSSLKHRLLPLAEDTVVIPGHGPETTLGDERRYNPFVRRILGNAGKNL